MNNRWEQWKTTKKNNEQQWTIRKHTGQDIFQTFVAFHRHPSVLHCVFHYFYVFPIVIQLLNLRLLIIGFPLCNIVLKSKWTINNTQRTYNEQQWNNYGTLRECIFRVFHCFQLLSIVRSLFYWFWRHAETMKHDEKTLKNKERQFKTMSTMKSNEKQRSSQQHNISTVFIICPWGEDEQTKQ